MSEKAKWYKVTTKDFGAPFVYGFTYGKGLIPRLTGWHISWSGGMVCNRGYHATQKPSIWATAKDARVFEIKVVGKLDEDLYEDKAVFLAMKFVREIVPNSQEWVDLGLPPRS